MAEEDLISKALGIEFVPASNVEVFTSSHYFDANIPCPFKGQKHTEESKQLIAQFNKGKTYSPETIERMRLAKLGKKMSEETKKKMSESHMGEKNGFYGKKHSQETIDRITAKCKTLTPWNKGKRNGSA